MDKRLKEAVALEVSATMKGALFDPPPPQDMLTALQITRLEAAVERAPLTRKELIEAADEYRNQLKLAAELVPR